MIKTFADKRTEKIFRQERVKGIHPEVQQAALIDLASLNAAASLNDLAFLPGYHLEALKGDRKGQYSIRINRQWRICFSWQAGDAYDVGITDYH
jgi:proteic killer suppression protein